MKIASPAAERPSKCININKIWSGQISQLGNEEALANWKNRVSQCMRILSEDAETQLRRHLKKVQMINHFSTGGPPSAMYHSQRTRSKD